MGPPTLRLGFALVVGFSGWASQPLHAGWRSVVRGWRALAFGSRSRYPFPEMSSSSLTRPERPGPALEKLPEHTRYEVTLSSEEIVERMRGEEGVGLYLLKDLPGFGRTPSADHDFTIEIEEGDFRIHVGPPAVRGQSGTGVAKLLYLRGTLEPSERGTTVDLRFELARPQWAMQRWIGFMLCLSLGLVWVFVGGGELMRRIIFYGVFASLVTPVAVHDIRRGKLLEGEKLKLLNLMERLLGAHTVGEMPRGPFRKQLAQSDGG